MSNNIYNLYILSNNFFSLCVHSWAVMSFKSSYISCIWWENTLNTHSTQTAPRSHPEVQVLPWCLHWPTLGLTLTHREKKWYHHVYVRGKSLLTLCYPVDHSPPGSSVSGILQARILEWIVMPSSRGSSQPRYRTNVSSPTLAGRFFTPSATWEAPNRVWIVV